MILSNYMLTISPEVISEINAYITKKGNIGVLVFDVIKFLTEPTLTYHICREDVEDDLQLLPYTMVNGNTLYITKRAYVYYRKQGFDLVEKSGDSFVFSRFL